MPKSQYNNILIHIQWRRHWGACAPCPLVEEGVGNSLKIEKINIMHSKY